MATEFTRCFLKLGSLDLSRWEASVGALGRQLTSAVLIRMSTCRTLLEQALLDAWLNTGKFYSEVAASICSLITRM
jgi:hypothetical protein